jgi:hypothetical protein
VRIFNCPKRARRNARPALQTLENRLTPAGVITATFTAASGALVLTGDDAANVVKIAAGSGITLTPDANTTILGHPKGAPVSFSGTLRSLKVDMKGGDDDVSIDGTAPFQVAGAVKINLGDGNNNLVMNTTGPFSTGALTVTGGDGSDTVDIESDGTGTINGAARFTFNNGGSDLTLAGVSMPALSVTAGDAAGLSPNDVTLNGVTIARTVNVSLGNSNPALLAVTDSTIGGLTETGQVISALLQNTTVNGNVTLKGGFQADLEVQDGCIMNKMVGVSAPNASISGTGTGSMFLRNVNLVGTAFTQVSFQTTSVSEVQGSILVKGGWYNDIFDGNSFLKVDQNVALNLGGGDNSVTIGDGTGVALIFGMLSINSGAGDDTITLDDLKLSGSAKINTGAGADTLSIDDGTQFLSTFTADMGAGDDTISVAQDTAATSAVTFTGNAKITAGAGNDTLKLGKSVAAGGTQFTKVVFTDPTSTVDGGLGLNNYNSSTAQVNTFVLINWNP